MRASSGVSPVVVTLTIAVLILASASAYLGLVALSKTNEKSGTGGTGSYPVFPVPASNALSSGGSTAGSAPSNSITVSGAGQATYTPNEALLSVSVVASNTTAEVTTQTDAVVTGRVIRALNSIGVSNSSIQTQGYYLFPNYQNCYSSCVPLIVGYTVTNTLLVNLTSDDPTQLGLKAGKAIDTAVGAGANQVSLQFAATTSMLSSLNAQALRQAVSSASAQAQVIASSLGVTISGVISATTGSSYYPYSPPYYGTFGAAPLAAAVQSTPIMPGTQTVYASVQVVYSIS